MWSIIYAQLADGRVVDVDIDHERIVAVNAHDPQRTVGQYDINAEGLLLFPGGIDMHVHFRSPGFEHKEDWITGSRVAITSGYTSVFDMPNTRPAVITHQLLREKKEYIRKHAQVHFGCYIAATEDNYAEVIRAQHDACGVKLYYGTTTGGLTVRSPIEILRSLCKASLSIPIVIHAEDNALISINTEKYSDYTGKDLHCRIRDRETSISAVRAILSVMKEYPEAAVHLTHVSTQEEIQMIREAKNTYPRLTCDVTPHHLLFSEEEYIKNELLKVNPPLRTKADQKALLEGLQDGTIDCIASDHAPHTRKEKESLVYADTPSGIPSLEFALVAMLEYVSSGLLSYQRLVDLTASNPTKILSLVDTGSVMPGAHADLVLIDSRKRTQVNTKSIQSKCAWSALEGKIFSHRVISTIVDGLVVYSDDVYDL